MNALALVTHTYIRKIVFFVKYPKLSQPTLMFMDTASSLSKSGTPEKFFTGVGSGLTGKRNTRLERLGTDKQ